VSSLRVVREDLGEDVGPGHAREATNEPAGGELSPPLGGLEGVTGDVTAGESLKANNLVALEGGGTVDAKAGGEDKDKARAGEAAGNLSGISGAEGAKLDEGSSQEETVGKANLDAAGEGRDTSAVSGQVGEEVGHDGGGGHGSLKHADEGVTVDGLDNLSLVLRADGEGRLGGRDADRGEAADARAEEAGASHGHTLGRREAGGHGGSADGLHFYRIVGLLREAWSGRLYIY